MPPKREGEPLSSKNAEKMPRLINEPATNDISQIQELECALEQKDNDSRVLHLIREVAETPNLPTNLTLRLLKFCVKVDSEDALRQLLDSQAIDLNTREGGELLWAAVEEGKEEISGLLIYRGADLSVRRPGDNRSFLQQFLRSNKIKYTSEREKVVRLLMDLGADVNARDSAGYSVLNDAIKSDHCSVQLVEELLDRGAQVSNHMDIHFNDLFWASRCKLELLPRLIEHRVPDEETRNKRAAMAFQFLISEDGPGVKMVPVVRMIKKILDLGVPADIDIPTWYPRETRPFLSAAVYLKKKDVVKLLLDNGADPRRKDELGHTPLFRAAYFKGYTHVSRWLIEKGASINDRCDDGSYPIHGACLSQSLRNTHLFLNLGADMNVTDNQGQTPFVCTGNPTKYNEAHSLMIKHLALWIARGMKISDEDMASVNRNVRSKEHFDKCTNQLERMKVEYIRDRVSHFSLLSKNMSYKLIKLMRNRNFVECFKNNLKKRIESKTDLFPEYSYMLLHSFEVAEKRLEMLLVEKEKLREAFPEAMPDHIVENITYYFSFEKLERCQHDYYMSLHANLKNTLVDKAKIL